MRRSDSPGRVSESSEVINKPRQRTLPSRTLFGAHGEILIHL